MAMASDLCLDVDVVKVRETSLLALSPIVLDLDRIRERFFVVRRRAESRERKGRRSCCSAQT